MAIFAFKGFKHSSDEESLPPTYEQSQAAAPVASIVLPGETATPQQVRDFLVRLMIAKRNIPDSRAQLIASKWTIAAGKELRTYGVSRYTKLFGPADGCTVYKEVKTLVYQQELDERKAKNFWICNRAWIRTIAIALIALICDGLLLWAIICAFSTNDTRVIWGIGTIPAFLIVSLIGMIVVAVTFPHTGTPESRAEGDTKRYYG